MPWEVTKITAQPGRYRYRVEGVNTVRVPSENFFWAVPDVRDAEYIPHKTASPEVVAALMEAKNTHST